MEVHSEEAAEEITNEKGVDEKAEEEDDIAKGDIGANANTEK